MVPSKLSRHFSKQHGYLSDKLASYFKRLLEKRKQQSGTFTKTFQVSTKSQHASYLVAEIMAKNSKPHTEAEKVIFPACNAIEKTMFGAEAEDKIKQIPLSYDTIRRRFCDMSTDIQDTVISSVKQSKMFTLRCKLTNQLTSVEKLNYSFLSVLSVVERYLTNFSVVKNLKKERQVKIFLILLVRIWKKMN